MIINTISKSSYNVEGQVTATTENRATIALPSKPYVVLAIPRAENPFNAIGRFAYVILNPSTNTYIAKDQKGAKDGTVEWTERTSIASWDDAEKKITLYVQCPVGNTITYHAVG